MGSGGGESLSSPVQGNGRAGSKGSRRRPARERLIATADHLLYTAGLASTAVERILQEADVARGTFYATFRDKNELVDAYLRERHRRTMDVLRAIEEAHTDLDDQLDAIFDYLAAQIAEGGFRGCPFVLAAAEDPGIGAVGSTWASHHKRQVTEVFQNLFERAEFSDPPSAADQLSILYDGALVTGAIQSHSAAADSARSMAHRLFALPDGAMRSSKGAI